MQFYASKNVGQFAPESLGQFDWIVQDIAELKFSSFTSLCSQANTKLERDYVMKIFGGQKAFREYHSKPIDRKYKWHD